MVFDTQQRIQDFVDEVTEDDPMFVRMARLSWLIDEITSIEAWLADFYDRRRKYRETDHPYWFYGAVMENLHQPEKMLKKLKWLKIEWKTLLYKKMAHHDKKEPPINSIDIQRARDYPLSQLLEINKYGYAKCINHEPDEHPSMYCKNNYAYCFTCGYSGDVIDVAMKVNGIGFVEAVIILCK